MNKFIFIALFLFLIFSSHTFAVPNPLKKRQGDPMSGLKPCDGKTFPITYTRFTFDPNPVVAGKPFSAMTTGTSKTTIQPGAIFKAEAYSSGKLVFTQQHDYCEGRKCPIGPGDFKETRTEVLPVSPNDPVNTTMAFDTRFQLINPDQTVLMCLDGPFSITFP